MGFAAPNVPFGIAARVCRILKEACEDIRGIIFEEKFVGRSRRHSGISILEDCLKVALV